MKWMGLLLAVSTALCAAETVEQRGKRVIDEAVAALGGEKFLTMEDRIEEGRAYSFYRDQLTGLSRAKIYTRYLNGAPKDGLAQRERQSFGKDEDYLILFTENKGYQVTYRGAKPLAEERLQRHLDSTRRNILYILRHRLKEPGMIFEGKGSNVWQNNPVEVVDITDSANNVVTVYFSRNTKLPMYQTYVIRDPKTKDRDEFSTAYAKYRDVGGGVQWPFHIRSERNGEKTFEMFADAVTVNQNLTDSLFTLDAKLRLLPADK
jgi:hypothetical protein